MPENTTENESFLNELQIEGQAKAGQENEFMSLDDAIAQMCHIKNEEAIAHFKATPEADWETAQMRLYCHDCRKVVNAGVGKTLRGNPRTVCGECKSKKVSSGTFEALKRFYHLNEEGAKERSSKS